MTGFRVGDRVQGRYIGPGDDRFPGGEIMAVYDSYMAIQWPTILQAWEGSGSDLVLVESVTQVAEKARLQAEIEAVKAQQAEALRAMSRSNRRHIARRLEGAKDILASAIAHYARSYETETFEGQRDVRRLQCGSEIAHVITLLAEAGAMLTTQALGLAPYEEGRE